ncbi:response regulator transcription factor [Streptomyces sp. JH14]|uniref:helix-turn-helix transcriptional regulator n=1 Tax=Streptomyces sp. JH14 TaxID=2793630 RepID=UPI0023FA0D2C|nr:response regulator transcription factor [Streptomyces sp. JH14]MDF6046215.1 response regulator transcription factor [Streptomyces sp. JH14]
MTTGSAATLPVPARPGSAGRTRLTAVPVRAEGGHTNDPMTFPGSGREPAPLTVAVTAGDTITAEGAEAYLRGAEGVRVVDWGAWDGADIALVLVHRVTDRTIGWMERVCQETEARGGLPILLVADEISERDLVRAVRYGLVGILLRREVGYARVLEAARSSLEGSAPMPARLVRSLVESMRSLASAVQQHGTDLSGREVDVLRLLAQGLSTADVAARLNYSERTIKNVLHEMITRLGLRNRTHAVAYAIKRGVV